jgi:hypothetical protein
MAAFGDVLRGLGSVLNPQVAQELGAEDRIQQQAGNQVGMLMLQKRLEQQSPEYQARLEALNNERQFRAAAQASAGDPVKLAEAAVTYGKPDLAVSLYNQQQARADRLQAARDQLVFREKELQQRAEDKAADREQRAQAQADLADLKRQQLSLQGEIAKGNQDLKRMQFQMQGDQQLVKQTQQLGSALEKANLPEADSVLGAVEEAVKKNPDLASYISGPKSLLPDMAVGTDIAAGRQAFQKLFNITLKNRSGSAVTNQELERLKQEFATGAFKTPAQLQKAVDQARNIINKHYASVASGFSPDALKAYNENLRGFGGRVVLEAPASSGGWSVEEVK